MKDFDLDKFDKKVPYSVPENFFEEMQEVVIQKTIHKSSKKTKVFHLFSSKTIGIAATVVLLVVLTFLWNKTKTEESSIEEKPTFISQSVNENKAPNLTILNSENLTAKDENFVEAVLERNEETKQINVTSQHEQFLISLSDDELDEFFENTEHDIYFELYTNN